MPVQCLIRKLTRPQVDKAILDLKAKITVRPEGDCLLLVVTNQTEAGDPAANIALQKIADADAAIMQKERADAEAKEAAAKEAAKGEKVTLTAADVGILRI
ncbi:MAG: hypothetical protein E4H03_09900 [Myxococcales bacterium]|nr:MAG: hypothetical protein E4H03_09900 [Myxococcales bacterium]